MKVSEVCIQYFNSLCTISNFTKNDHKTNALAFLAILTYFTVIIPLGFAAAYSVSLCGRVNKKSDLTDTDKRVDSLGPKTPLESKNDEASEPEHKQEFAFLANFEASTKNKAEDAKIFIRVFTKDQKESQLVKFSHFGFLEIPSVNLNENKPPIHDLVGEDLFGRSVFINMSNIRSIEISPRIERMMKSLDKADLAKTINFDENGVIILPTDFTSKISVEGYYYVIKIYTQKKVRLVTITANCNEDLKECTVKWF